MRASLLGLVIATTTPFLWAVKAQDNGPTIIGIGSPALTANTSYTVTLEGCAEPSCTLIGVSLLQTQSPLQPIAASTLYSLTTVSCVVTGDTASGAQPSCFQGIAPPLITTSVYKIDVAFRTATATSLDHTIGSPLAIDPLVAASTSSTLPSSTTPTPSSTAAPGRASDSKIPVGLSSTQSARATTAASTPSSSPITTSTPPVSGNTNDSSGLSTGAKVGIAIGAVGSALLILIAALLLWRRSRQRQLQAFPNREPYSHDMGSMNRDLTAEKEMHVLSSPVDTLHGGYSSIPPVAEIQNRSPRGSYPQPDGHTAADSAPYSDAPHGSYGSGYENSASPTQDSQAHMPPPAAAAAGPPIQRKPVGVASGPTHHLREPGMSDEEVARLEEEERRIDEAIAEAERKRQL